VKQKAQQRLLTPDQKEAILRCAGIKVPEWTQVSSLHSSRQSLRDSSRSASRTSPDQQQQQRAQDESRSMHAGESHGERMR
jgi:hypothetical protein